VGEETREGWNLTMRKRDVLILPFRKDESLVFSTDNSGGIGLKEQDEVKVPYDIVSYYGVRVVAMELLSAGVQPNALIIHSFNGDEAWGKIIEGAQKVFEELKLHGVEITGSTETNFTLIQSATSFTLAGMVKNCSLRVGKTPPDAMYAVVGEPLVGQEVLEQPEKMLPFLLFSKLLEQEGIYEIIPVGSKGIQHELEILSGMSGSYSCELPLMKSAGPATCVVISYSKAAQESIQQLCGSYFFGV
jgi:hypothetical protein